MLGPRPIDEIDTLPNDDPSAVIDGNIVLQDDSFQLLRDPQTSLEAFGPTHHVEQEPPKTSLEILESAHYECQTNLTSNIGSRDNNDDPLQGSSSAAYNEDASRIPLPATSGNFSSSYPSSTISSPASSIGTVDVTDHENPVTSLAESCSLYQKKNIRLSKRFPHLASVCSGSRHDKANITTFDYTGGVLRDVKHQSFDFNSYSNPQSPEFTCPRLEDCRRFICSIDSSLLETRLVIVEDLGPSLINLLGGTFDLSPEFFGEHLYSSYYHGPGISEASPSTWRTSNLQKDYASFTWSRPGECWSILRPAQWKDLLTQDYAAVGTIEQIDNRNRQSSNVFHKFMAKTNIFRWPSELSTDPDGRVPDNVPCGWRERATVCNKKFNGLQYVILLLDPVPLLEMTTIGIADAMGPVISRSKHKEYSSNCKFRSKPTKASEQQDDWYSQTEILSSFTQTQCRTPWNVDYRSLFLPTTNPAAQEAFERLSPFQSTLEAFKQWLSSASAKEVDGYGTRLGPASMIFRIAHQDTMGLLQLMRSAVTEIDLASSDIELQETALHWRCRLDEFRALLLEIEASLQSFRDFLYAGEGAPSKDFVPKLVTDPIQYLLQDALNAIEAHKQRISQVYSSLTSKTQISDSHRSIAEAETVTRLTELAFLFIPLSFSTSIFGMQFVSGSTPATTYIAVALALTSGAYLLRFIINRTTEQRLDLKRSLSDRITAFANLRAGSRIPTATFVRWLVHVVKRFILKFGKLSFLGAIILIVLIIPLPIIWTSSLNRGLQTALSCVLISIPTCFVCSYYGSRYLKRRKLARARDGFDA